MGLDPEKTVIIKPNNKQLPFPGAASKYSVEKKNVFVTRSFDMVGKLIENVNKNAPKVTTIVLEDLTHYFSERVMNEVTRKDYDKWTELGASVYKNIVKQEADLRPDLNLIVVAHTTASADLDGNPTITLQTPGKLLENVVKIPSYFTYVLHTVVTEDREGIKYQFLTNRQGGKLAKSPEGCLPLYMENDYTQVIEKITKYQNG